jgi:hypothetical protein
MENLNINLKERAGIVTAESQGAKITLASAAEGLKTLTIEFMKEGKMRSSSHQLISLEELQVLQIALEKFLKEENININIE